MEAFGKDSPMVLNKTTGSLVPQVYVTHHDQEHKSDKSPSFYENPFASLLSKGLKQSRERVGGCVDGENVHEYIKTNHLRILYFILKLLY
jgi:hypothetical protein